MTRQTRGCSCGMADYGTPGHDGAPTVATFIGHDGALVVQIDTFEGTGRVRVNLNDSVIYDGDPEVDEP